MASNIDVSKPISGTPTTASVRQNFSYAKSEIEAIQSDVITLQAVAQVWYNANAYATLADAVTAVSGDDGVIIISDNQAVTDDLEIPINCSLKVYNTGKLTITAAKTLTISGSFEAERRQVFYGDGVAVFNYIAKVSPLWWGAIPQTNSDAAGQANNLAFDYAMDAITTNGGKVIVDDTYYIGGVDLSWSGFEGIINLEDNVTIEGITNKAMIKVVDDMLTNYGDFNMFYKANLQHFTMKNITIDGNGTNNIATSNQSMGGLSFPYGNDITIDNVTWQYMSGRGQISGGWNGTPAERVKVVNCKFLEVGGALAGNSAQDDHSSLYATWHNSEITGNVFYNSTIQDFTSPSRTVCAIESHSANTVISNNQFYNFTYGILNATYAAEQITNNVVIDSNTLEYMQRGGITSDGTSAYNNLVISNNTVEINSTYGADSTGIIVYKGNNVTISDNIVRRADSTAGKYCYGIVFAGNDNIKIEGNNIEGLMTTSIDYYSASAGIDKNILIANNIISGATSKCIGVHVDSPQIIDGIKIDDNICSPSDIFDEPYGITVNANNTITNLIIGSGNVFNTNGYSHRVVVGGSKLGEYTIEPRYHSSTTAANPTSGIFISGQDIVLHTDAAHSGTIGKVCTSSGAAYGATWGATTAYAYGQWVLMPGASKIAKCTVAGTSGGSEPTMPAHYGDTVVDGTATWEYKSDHAATFYTFGTIS